MSWVRWPGWPERLLVAAAAIALGHAALTVLGLEGYVSILCGMIPAGPLALALGVLYVASHFSFVVAAPIFGFAGCLGLAVRRRRP